MNELITYLESMNFSKPWKKEERFDKLAVYLSEDQIKEIVLALELLQAKRSKKKQPKIEVIPLSEVK